MPQKTPQQIRNERATREAQALPRQAALPFTLPVKGLKAAIRNAPPVDPELGTAPDPNDILQTDIPLMSEPQSPDMTPPWKVGPPLVSRGGDMAPNSDDFNVGGNMSGMMATPPPSRYSPNPGQSAQSLRGLAGSSYSPGVDSSQQDPTVQRYNLNQQFADENQDRIIANQRAAAASYNMSNPQAAQQNVNAYTGEANALKNLLAINEQDIAESPITAGIKEANDYGQQERQAILAGYQGGSQPGGNYENPIQAASRGAREMETAKINAPVEAQRVAGQYDVEKQRLAGQTALDVANSKAAAQEAALNAAFATGKPIRSMNPTSGAFSFEPTRNPNQGVVNPSLLRDITTTRTNLKNRGGTNSLFGGMLQWGESPESIAYKSAVAAALSQHPADYELKDLATMIGSHPEFDSNSTQQILQMLSDNGNIDMTGITEQDVNQLDQLLNITRGLQDTNEDTGMFPFNLFEQ